MNNLSYMSSREGTSLVIVKDQSLCAFIYLSEFVCVQIGIKYFWPETFYCCSEKKNLCHKIYPTSEGASFSQCYQQLSNGRYQVSFEVNMGLE